MKNQRYATASSVVSIGGGMQDAMAQDAATRREQEKVILQRCRNGDRRAYGHVVETYQAKVFGTILRMVGSRTAAEDITQEAFVRAYVNIDRFDPERPFLPWILRIAINLSYNWFKAAARREVPDLPHEEFLQFQKNRPIDERLGDIQRMENALQAIPPKYRIPLILKHVEGMDYKEIKEVLGTPITALKMRVSRARSMLRKILSDMEQDNVQ